jgi:ribosomal protein S18 acetylase RimI-like enzyme
VLRTGRPLSEALFEADDDPRNAHFAAIDRASVNDPSAVLAVGSVLLEPPDWDISDPHAWRIRGMAARPEVRGRGLGGKVLAALLDYVRQMNGDLVWCTARVPALRLYERFGFEPRGEQSERPGIGPHQTMYTRVDRATTTP